MQEKSLITKVSQVFERNDGSQVRIVVQRFFGLGLTPYDDVMVHSRKNENESWHLCSNKPHTEWRTMSVEEYKTRGRSEVLQKVSIGEILKLKSLLGKPMTH